MYEQEISRRNPGCFLFLLDQSYSMGAPISGSPAPKSSALATMINELLYAIVLECTKDFQELPRHYFDVGVIGYSGTGSALCCPAPHAVALSFRCTSTQAPADWSSTLTRCAGRTGLWWRSGPPHRSG